MTQPLLQVHDIRCTLGNRSVLRGVSLHANPGEFIALLGENGVGKSTLLDLVAAIRPADSGKVMIDGRDIHRIHPVERARLVCHLPQGIRSNLPFHVEQVVRMGRSALSDAWLESPEDQRAVEEALQRTGCLDFRLRPFSALSGGERQRVLLAACLAQQARILLMDEPSTYLDLQQQLHCFQLLREEADRGCLAVTITHDVNLALAHCSRIIILREGVVAADMSREEAWQHSEWLHWFSSRLRVEQSLDGASWVAYR